MRLDKKFLFLYNLIVDRVAPEKTATHCPSTTNQLSNILQECKNE